MTAEPLTRPERVPLDAAICPACRRKGLTGMSIETRPFRLSANLGPLDDTLERTALPCGCSLDGWEIRMVRLRGGLVVREWHPL